MKTFTVITGASSGIGYEVAKAFARRGKNLILTARREHRLTALKDELLQLHPTLEVIVKASDLSVPQNAHRFYAGLQGYPLETWVNNAGFGDYNSVARLDLAKIQEMLHLNIEALTILSSLFVRDYRNVVGSQLINVSSCGGYQLVPTAVSYCASKFYVSAFTEGLARELKAQGNPLQAKVLAPAATETEFGKRASGQKIYVYDQHFTAYHSSQQMAEFLLALYDSDQTVGIVDRNRFQFSLCGPLLPCAQVRVST
ncbi:MAG: SDR family NAD(P)-dependent oxidoreductase [Ruminiclostridium sp.]|jgi:short-subunit dehydrogenase|nr:SDR family NAD(P)-dependent oxidoreductase [Ruminiclostridium sp.]